MSTVVWSFIALVAGIAYGWIGRGVWNESRLPEPYTPEEWHPMHDPQDPYCNCPSCR